MYDVTDGPPVSQNLLYAPQYQNNNGSATSQTLLDQGTNPIAPIPNWNADYSIPIEEQNRVYSLQCRKVRVKRVQDLNLVCIPLT